MAGATVPLHQFEKLKREYDEIRIAYGDSLVRLEKAKKQLAKARIVIKEWQRYVDKHPKYVKAAEKQGLAVAANEITTPSPTANSTAALVVSEVAIRPETRSFESYDLPGPETVSPIDAADDSATDKRPEPEPSLHKSSSQTTDSGIDSTERNQSVAQQPSAQDQDEPIVVCARPVKKPRSGRVKQAVHQQPPRRIKREITDEDGCLPPIPSFRPSYTQASDLDAGLGEINTPRKRQKTFHEPVSFDDSTPRTRKLSRSFENVVDENTPPSSATNALAPRHASQGSPTPRSSRGALQPLSTNTPILPVTSAPDSKSNRRRQHDEITRRGLQMLGEDNPEATVMSPSTAQKQRRLDNLLDGATTLSDKGIIAARTHSAGPQTARKPLASSFTVMTGAKNSASKTVKPRSHSPTAYMPPPRERPVFRPFIPQPGQPPPPDPRPEEEPLRCKPVSRMSLDDFKINSAYFGSDFAFNTSIRDRANRACLPSCTGPCCAALMRFADTRGGASRGSEDDDERVLHDHLSHSDTQHLSVEQKKDLITTARAEKFAKQHGRHKQVFERQRTPPGFWRTDMPSTQELEDDRKRAKAQERDEVLVRWHEAMRTDRQGRWRFRDEA